MEINFIHHFYNIKTKNKKKFKVIKSTAAIKNKHHKK